MQPRANYFEVVLAGRKPVRFGRLLSREQRHAILEALQQLQQAVNRHGDRR